MKRTVQEVMKAVSVVLLLATAYGMPITYETSGDLNFPSTIWLGGVVPYKIDKQFEQFMRSSLSQYENNKPPPVLLGNRRGDIEYNNNIMHRLPEAPGLRSLSFTESPSNPEPFPIKLRIAPSNQKISNGLASFNMDTSKLFPAIGDKMRSLSNVNNFDNEHSRTNQPSQGFHDGITIKIKKSGETVQELDSALEQELGQMLTKLLDENLNTTLPPPTTTAQQESKLKKALRNFWI